ncbi:MAG: zinc metallopeptidase [Verrucomicrobiae bacterium]|nr:zinc metallopeptidase [Verrucomicrobiae bacterium]
MFYFGWWDLIPIPGFLLALYAQFKLRGLYAKYHDVPQSRGLTGAEVAQAILDRAGIANVAIEPCAGELTDHYDPKNRVLRLSEPNFRSSSLSAIGVAAHEAGHAIQHKERYAPLEMRMSIVGATQLATSAGMILFLVGLFLHSGLMLQIGIWCYSAIVIFQLITLPVEYDASRRAKLVLAEIGLVNRDEGEAIRKVLGAAALTYVAGLATALLELIRMIALANAARSRN